MPIVMLRMEMMMMNKKRRKRMTVTKPTVGTKHEESVMGKWQIEAHRKTLIDGVIF